MAQAIPSPQDCCEPCPDDITTQIPGAPGDPGADGADGADGSNAFTTLTSGFTMPGELADVAIVVGDTSWMVARQGAVQGQIIYIEFAGHFEVRSIADATNVTVRNLEDTPNALYPDNAPPTTAIPAAARVSPAGLQGPDGTAAVGSAPDTASYVTTTDETGTLASSFNLGGIPSGVLQQTVAAGVSSPSIADLLTAIEALAANGLITRTAATTAAARTITGTASLITVTNGDGVSGNPTINVGANVYVVGGTDVALADGGTGSSTAAGARSNLSLTRAVGAYLLFYHEETDGVAGGGFTSGSWQTVPINTEVSDVDSQGSISGNDITLAAGTYRYHYGIVGYKVDTFQGRIFNVTDAGTITGTQGTVVRTTNTDDEVSVAPGVGIFTLATSKTIRVEAQSSFTKATDGFGLAGSFGVGERYSFIEFWKEAG